MLKLSICEKGSLQLAEKTARISCGQNQQKQPVGLNQKPNLEKRATHPSTPLQSNDGKIKVKENVHDVDGSWVLICFNNVYEIFSSKKERKN